MYKSLKVYYYENPTDLDAEHQRRLESPETTELPLSIYPYDKRREMKLRRERYSLFFMMTDEMKQLIKGISNNSKQLKEVIADEIVHKQLIEEIKHSNELEGVRFSKVEIEKAVNEEGTPYFNMVKMYQKLTKDEEIDLDEVSDFRKLYDQLLFEDIHENLRPDGKYFRTKPIFLQGLSGRIHEGDKDEEEISGNIAKLIQFNQQEETSKLLQAIISLYFIEYIHPFYSGNGCLGRYLASMKIGAELDVLTSLSVATSILNNRTQYTRAFSDMNESSNRGDLTLFILTCLEGLKMSQEELLEKVK